jgi:glycosyltransferase involved in cell wall biosynthesis
MEADLILNKQDFGMAFPQWENGQFVGKVDPYSLDSQAFQTLRSSPSWVKIWDQERFGSDILSHSVNRIDLYRLVKGYDLIEAHAPFAIYAQFLKAPYIVYDAGWVRYFPFGDDSRDRLARRGYMKARAVLVTNPDTFYIFDKLAYVKRTLFMPFVIDLEIYRPMRTTVRNGFDCDLLLFAPSRQIWHEKGNDKLLRGFAQFLQGRKIKSLLIITDWGPDAQRSKRLAEELGISRYVRWLKPVHKRELVQYYNAADVILDQFVLGSYGTAAPEAMACEKPVIMYYSKPAFTRSFGKHPPLLNAYTPDEIAEHLDECSSRPYRKEIGRKSREWVAEQHNWRLVVERHKRIYSFVVGECEWQDVLNA